MYATTFLMWATPVLAGRNSGRSQASLEFATCSNLNVQIGTEIRVLSSMIVVGKGGILSMEAISVLTKEGFPLRASIQKL